MPGGAAVAGMMTMVLGLSLGLGRGGDGSCAGAAWQPRRRHDRAVSDARAIAHAGRGRECRVSSRCCGFGKAGRSRACLTLGGRRRARRRARTSGRSPSAATPSPTGSRGSPATASFACSRISAAHSFATRCPSCCIEFPLGAGLGRWGMMHVYFGDPTLWQAPPIHVEVQLDRLAARWRRAAVAPLRRRADRRAAFSYRAAVRARTQASCRTSPPSCCACSSRSSVCV